MKPDEYKTKITLNVLNTSRNSSKPAGKTGVNPQCLKHLMADEEQ